MIWDEWAEHLREQQNEQQYEIDADEERRDKEEEHPSYSNFDFLSLFPQPKDYYRILEVDYDATEDVIRSNYIRLALKWHPDKLKDQDCANSRFQEINEAYQVLSDPVKRQEYDNSPNEFLNMYKGLLLTCNGLGMKHWIW